MSEAKNEWIDDGKQNRTIRIHAPNEKVDASKEQPADAGKGVEQ